MRGEPLGVERGTREDVRGEASDIEGNSWEPRQPLTPAASRVMDRREQAAATEAAPGRERDAKKTVRLRGALPRRAMGNPSHAHQESQANPGRKATCTRTSVGKGRGGLAMSLFDERALREIVAEEVRRVLREELLERGRPVGDVEFLPVAVAAARVAVAPATIRGWMAQGPLGRYRAGRELRVRIAELAALMQSPANSNAGNPNESTPEKEAALYLDRRRQAGPRKVFDFRSTVGP
jgi:hypothetical protein